jgi:hypothetical protein
MLLLGSIFDKETCMAGFMTVIVLAFETAKDMLPPPGPLLTLRA